MTRCELTRPKSIAILQRLRFPDKKRALGAGFWFIGGERQPTDAEQTPGGKPERIDPFAEGCGGKHDLLEVVLALIGQSNFDEPIVIQGAAGSGKSTFTLKLCPVLEKEGLYPIRVRLRDLPLDRPLAERGRSN